MHARHSSAIARMASPLLPLLLLLLLAFVSLPSPTAAISFQLKQGEETCLSEDVLPGELLIGDFSISPSDGRVSVTVADTTGSSVYSKSVSDAGKFAHTASASGEYRMCFHNSESPSLKTVSLSLSAGGRDYAEMAKKDNLKPLEIELKRLEDAVGQIHQEMKFLQTREQQMRATNDSTASRVWWWSILSILVLLAVNGGQIFYLKSFFKAKKLIH